MSKGVGFRCASGSLGFAVLFAVASIALCVSFAQAQTSALPPELERVRAALEKYKDPVVAIHDGYFSTLGCVEYPTGGMGVHFLNTHVIAPAPDPMRPQILVYEPDGDKLRLVAAEWFIPLATGVKERPQLFGRPFDGPMEGHHPLMPTELHHYDLHVWLFKSNPAGLFNATNPGVKCPKTGYSFMEHPPSPSRTGNPMHALAHEKGMALQDIGAGYLLLEQSEMSGGRSP